MEIVEWVPLIALGLGALVAVGGVVVTLVLGLKARASVVLAVAAAALLIVWVALTYQSGIRADETGLGGNVFSDVGWLVAAAGAGVLSAVAAVRTSRGDRRAGTAPAVS